MFETHENLPATKAWKSIHLWTRALGRFVPLLTTTWELDWKRSVAIEQRVSMNSPSNDIAPLTRIFRGKRLCLIKREEFSCFVSFLLFRPVTAKSFFPPSFISHKRQQTTFNHEAAETTFSAIKGVVYCSVFSKIGFVCKHFAKHVTTSLFSGLVRFHVSTWIWTTNDEKREAAQREILGASIPDVCCNASDVQKWKILQRTCWGQSILTFRRAIVSYGCLVTNLTRINDWILK